MKLFITGIICLLFLASFGVSSDAAQSPLVGEWVGGYEINENYTPVKVHFSSEENEIKATFDFPMREETGVSLNQVKFQSQNLHFELLRDAGAIIFDGKFSGYTITGDIQRGDERGTFHLVRTVTVDPKVFDRYVGDYQIERDKYISIGRTNYPTAGIVFTESDTNRFGQLFPTSETTFFGGSARLVPYPVEINVTFVKNKQGQVTALKWKPKDSRKKTAKKVKLFKQEEVKFNNGDVTLAGTLTLPLTKAPYPAVVLIHGSDPNTRFKGLPQLFARHGIAALSYDKRGAGASTGDLNKATFDDLAGDVLAGVQFLQSRHDIDSKEIGLWAISQGGWIAPLVAARSPNIAFTLCATLI